MTQHQTLAFALMAAIVIINLVFSIIQHQRLRSVEVDYPVEDHERSVAISELRCKTQGLESQQRELIGVLDRMGPAVSKMLDDFEDSTGGLLWKTQDGHRVTARQMTDTHLSATLSFMQNKARSAANMRIVQALKNEIRRREIDDTWARRQGTKSLRDRVRDLEVSGRSHDPRTMQVLEEMERSRQACEDFLGRPGGFADGISVPRRHWNNIVNGIKALRR